MAKKSSRIRFDSAGTVSKPRIDPALFARSIHQSSSAAAPATTFEEQATVAGSIEREVVDRLQADRQLNFASLNVRHFKNGVCLEGSVQFDSLTGSAGAARIDELARQVAGVERIINQLVVFISRDESDEST